MAIWRGWSAGAFFRVHARWPSATSGSGSRRIWCGRCALRSPPIPTNVPPWQLRSWLLLYDRLASRSGLPASATVDVTHHPLGNALKRPFGTAFEYSDCVVDDSRLVVV